MGYRQGKAIGYRLWALWPDVGLQVLKARFAAVAVGWAFLWVEDLLANFHLKCKIAG